MDLNESLKDEIAEIFRNVKYGKIIFSISPERKTLDYSIETTHKIQLEDYKDYPVKVLTKCER